MNAEGIGKSQFETPGNQGGGNPVQSNEQYPFTYGSQPQTEGKGIGSRKGLKIGMKVSWGVVAAGIAAAAVTLALMLASPIAIPLHAVLIPAGIALAVSIPAITTTVLHNKAKNQSNEYADIGYEPCLGQIL